MANQDPPGRRRDIALLDDYASIAILASVLLVVLAVIAGGVYLLATGAVGTDVSVTGDITVSGTIPLGTVVLGVLFFMGVIVYTALTDVYGSRRVENATEQLQEAGDDE